MRLVVDYVFGGEQISEEEAEYPRKYPPPPPPRVTNFLGNVQFGLGGGRGLGKEGKFVFFGGGEDFLANNPERSTII